MIRHIWQTDVRFHCPLLGYCLTLREQKAALRKCNYKIDAVDDSSLHSLLICECSRESKVAKRIERLLNEKYSREIKQWRERHPDELLAYTRDNLNHETFCSILWIIAVWMEMPVEKQDEIYRYLHNFTHQQFQMQKSILNRMTMTENQLKSLDLKYLTLRNEAVSLKEERIRLKRIVDEQYAKIESLQTQIGHFENALAQHSIRKTEKLQEKLDKGNYAFIKISKERDQLKRELQAQAKAFTHLQNEFHDFINQIQLKENCQNLDCPGHSLCERRVLLVGGITKLRSFYQKVVKELGGEFDYHDGTYLKGEKALQMKISRSDIVLCPVDVNSHAACLGVKKHSKKQNKSYFMLPNSSISAVYNTLQELAVKRECI